MSATALPSVANAPRFDVSYLYGLEPVVVNSGNTIRMQINTKFRNVDEYLSFFSPEVRVRLESLRSAIRMAAPKATEVISYNMPAYKQHGILVYFASYSSHIGLYPTASDIRAFQKELSAYKFSKGAIRFPIDAPLPLTLVTRIVKFRVKEDREKAALKTRQ